MKQTVSTSQRARERAAIRKLCLCALLCAMSVTLAYLAKMIFGTSPLRLTFENLPIVFAGIVYGPIWGGVVGMVADLTSCLFAGQAPVLLITVGAAAVGMLAGTLSRLLFKKQTFPSLLAIELITQLIASVGIKSFALHLYFSYPPLVLLPRLPIYIGIAVAESYLLYILLRHTAIRRLILPNDTKDTRMTYQQAIDYIHSVSWKGSRPGLERIRALLDALGHPERDLRFVHIAGTNGKGSVSAMTESILRTAGYKTGLFVSPYIKHFNERIQFMGEPIPEQALADATAIVRRQADRMEDAPTEFELITAIGFVYFKQCGCDIVVLEVGMGGRLDSTNIIEDPLLTVITGIALDHTAFLGDTIEAIAKEKAGIIKPGCPVVYGGYDPVARRVIAEAAEQAAAPLLAAADTPIELHEMTLDGTLLSYGDMHRVHLPLLGSYQPRNAATVLCAVCALRDRGLCLPEEAVRQGLQAVRWPGRFEVLRRHPLIISDGAHNPEGIHAAADSLRLYFKNTPVLLLCGVMADKDHGQMVRELAPLASEVFTVRPNNPRALAAEALAEEFRASDVTAHAHASVADAVTEAVARAEQTGQALICLGSLYMYEEVTDALDTIPQKGE